MNTTTNLENISSYEVTQEEKEMYMTEVLGEINELYEDNDGILPFFERHIPKGLEQKLIDAFNGKFQDGENPILFSEGKYFIYADEFTSDEIKEIVIAYYGEEDVDFMIRLQNDGYIEEGECSDFFMHLSEFPGNVIGAISHRVSSIIDRIRKST